MFAVSRTCVFPGFSARPVPGHPLIPTGQYLHTDANTQSLRWNACPCNSTQAMPDGQAEDLALPCGGQAFSLSSWSFTCRSLMRLRLSKGLFSRPCWVIMRREMISRLPNRIDLIMAVQVITTARILAMPNPPGITTRHTCINNRSTGINHPADLCIRCFVKPVTGLT